MSEKLADKMMAPIDDKPELTAELLEAVCRRFGHVPEKTGTYITTFPGKIEYRCRICGALGYQADEPPQEPPIRWRA